MFADLYVWMHFVLFRTQNIMNFVQKYKQIWDPPLILFIAKVCECCICLRRRPDFMRTFYTHTASGSIF